MDYINIIKKYTVVLVVLFFSFSLTVKAKDKVIHQVELITEDDNNRIICSVILEENPDYNNVFCVYKFGEYYYRNNNEGKDGLVNSALKEIKQADEYIKIWYKNDTWGYQKLDEKLYKDITLKLLASEDIKNSVPTSKNPTVDGGSAEKIINFPSKNQKIFFNTVKDYIESEIVKMESFNSTEYFNLVNSKKTFEENKKIIGELVKKLERLKDNLKELGGSEEFGLELGDEISPNFFDLANIFSNNLETISEGDTTNNSVVDTEESVETSFLAQVNIHITKLEKALEKYDYVKNNKKLLQCNDKSFGKNKKICEKYKEPEDGNLEDKKLGYTEISELITEMNSYVTRQKTKYEKLEEELKKIENYIENIEIRSYLIIILVILISSGLAYIVNISFRNKKKDKKIKRIEKENKKIDKIIELILSNVTSNLIKNEESLYKQLKDIDEKTISKEIKDKFIEDNPVLIYQKALEEINSIVSNKLNSTEKNQRDAFTAILSKFSTSDTSLNRQIRQELSEFEDIKEYQQKQDNKKQIITEGVKEMFKSKEEKNTKLISKIETIIIEQLDKNKKEIEDKNKKERGELFKYFQKNEQKIIQDIYPKIMDIANNSLLKVLNERKFKDKLLSGTDIGDLTEKFGIIEERQSDFIKRQEEIFENNLTDESKNKINELYEKNKQLEKDKKEKIKELEGKLKEERKEKIEILNKIKVSLLGENSNSDNSNHTMTIVDHISKRLNEDYDLNNISEIKRKIEALESDGVIVSKIQGEARQDFIDTSTYVINNIKKQATSSIKDSSKEFRNQLIIAINEIGRKVEDKSVTCIDNIKNITDIEIKNINNSTQEITKQSIESINSTAQQKIKNIRIEKNNEIKIIKLENNQQRKTIEFEKDKEIKEIKTTTSQEIQVIEAEKQLILDVLKKRFDLSYNQQTTLSSWVKIIDHSFEEFSGDMHQMFHQRLTSAEYIYQIIQKEESEEDKNILRILNVEEILDKLSNFKKEQKNSEKTGKQWNYALRFSDKRLYNDLMQLADRLRTYFTMRNAHFNRLSLDIYILSYLGERFFAQEGKIVRIIRPDLLRSKKSDYGQLNYKNEESLLPQEYRKLIASSVMSAIDTEKDTNIVVDVHTYGYEYTDEDGNRTIDQPIVFTSIDSTFHGSIL